MSAYLTAVRHLREPILAARDAMDAERRLPAALADQLAEEGLHRMLIPRALGGPELHPLEFMTTLEALAEIDASVGWCVMIGATTGVMSAYMDRDTAEQIFGDPALSLAGVYAPTGTATIEGDSYRVSGRWKWNSGGQTADWIGGGCVITEAGAPVRGADGSPTMRMIFFPRSAAQFHDTWRTSGLKGTGSGDVSVENLIVPQARSASLTADAPRLPGPLYRFPVFGLLGLGIAAVASGNARAAIADFQSAAMTKRLPGGRLLGERSTVQAAFAQSQAEFSAARTFLVAETDAAWAQAEGKEGISLEQRARLRLAETHMVRTAAEIVRRLQDLAGGGAVFLSDPLHRRMCDAQTMTAHMMTAPPTLELTGRVLLGLPISLAEL